MKNQKEEDNALGRQIQGWIGSLSLILIVQIGTFLYQFGQMNARLASIEDRLINLPELERRLAMLEGRINAVNRTSLP